MTVEIAPLIPINKISGASYRTILSTGWAISMTADILPLTCFLLRRQSGECSCLSRRARVLAGGVAISSCQMPHDICSPVPVS